MSRGSLHIVMADGGVSQADRIIVQESQQEQVIYRLEGVLELSSEFLRVMVGIKTSQQTGHKVEVLRSGFAKS